MRIVPSYRCNCSRFAELKGDLVDRSDPEDNLEKVDSLAFGDQEKAEEVDSKGERGEEKAVSEVRRE